MLSICFFSLSLAFPAVLEPKAEPLQTSRGECSLHSVLPVSLQTAACQPYTVFPDFAQAGENTEAWVVSSLDTSFPPLCLSLPNS